MAIVLSGKDRFALGELLKVRETDSDTSTGLFSSFDRARARAFDIAKRDNVAVSIRRTGGLYAVLVFEVLDAKGRKS